MTQATFDKSLELFPIRKHELFLAHCSVSPLYSRADQAAAKFSSRHAELGIGLFADYGTLSASVRSKFSELLRTTPENISLLSNTSEGLNLIANGYPLEPGDEILTYRREFPANYYPWKLQERRGAVLRTISDADLTGSEEVVPCWSLSDLKNLVTPRTRVIALSHVQYLSGYTAELKTLGEFCRNEGIDLVIDAAQSLGVLPIYPEEHGISAVAACGWKWLLGPLATGMLYTSAEFRDKISCTMAGANNMQHWPDYQNLSWAPHHDGRKFEYSTVPFPLLPALEACLEDIFLKYPLEAVRDEVFRLQDILLSKLDPAYIRPLKFPEAHRSGLLAAKARVPMEELSRAAKNKGLTVVPRGEFLRLAPHFYNTEQEMSEAAQTINSVSFELLK